MTSIQSKAKKTPKPSTLRIGNRYRASRVDAKYDAIVIGSGIGGLTTAALMSKAGKRVLVLEQHYTAGGYTHSYSRNGYEWDVGVHYIGDMGNPKSQMRRVLDFVTDGSLKWAKMDETYDRFHFGKDVYDLKAGRENFQSMLEARFPKEKRAIRKYFKLLDRVNGLMPAIVSDKLMPELVTGPYNTLKKWILPAYTRQTTYEVLSQLTQNQRLIAVLTGQHGDCGLPPKESSFIIHALIAGHYLNGAYYPEGGAWRIADSIIPVIQASGGDVMTYAEVKRILIEDGKAVGVEMDKGHCIYAPKIISSAGVKNTFEYLLDQDTVKAHGYDDLMKEVSSSKAHLGMYIGLKGSPQELGLPKTNYWLFPHYDAQKAFDDFEADKEKPFPVLYISFPSAKDPVWQRNHPNKSTIELVVPCPYEWFEQWKDKPWAKRGDDYEALKDYFTQRMLEGLYEQMPQLRGKIDYYETSTPLSTEFFCHYKKGELYGLDHDPKRFEQSWLRPQTRIEGLYLSGQDVLTCGVGGAMMGGVLSAVSALGLESVKLVTQMGMGNTLGLAMPGVAKAGI